MTHGPTKKTAPPLEVVATAESHFSWLRTRLSTERTLMSWVRTAVSLIGFGFAIVQFFEHLNEMANVLPAARPQMPRYIGLSLIGSGTLALIVAAWEYRTFLRYLRQDEFKPIAATLRWHTPLFAVTLVLILIGLFTFGTVYLRMV